MHTFDGISNRLTFSLVLLLATWSITACDGSTIVSGNLSPDDVVVNADTIFIDSTSLIDSPAFSGNRDFFTSGTYDDPIFGLLRATAIIRPSLQFEEDVDTIGSNAVSWLSLNITNIYGPDTEPVDFEIVEIGRRWRSSSWRYDSIPDLTDQVVGQFTVTGNDSINVRLNDDWTERYLGYFHMSDSTARDSLYRHEMPGLAIVQAGETPGKLISVESSRARLLIENEGDLPGLTINMGSWAVSFPDVAFEEAAAGTSKPVYNTMGSMLKLDMELSEDFLGTNNFSRVELVLYEDTVGLEASAGTDPDFVRPRFETIHIYHLEPDQVSYAINVVPRIQANRNDNDGSYRINLTSIALEQMINTTDTRELYAVIGSNDGRILPMLISGTEDLAGRQPKILITSISQEQ